MNKTEVKAKIVELKELSVQDEDGQFVLGSAEQQEAALKVEMFLTCTGAGRDAELTAATLLGLKDIQVRDYAMGLVNPDNFNHYQSSFKWLTEKAPAEYNNGPTAILAITYYELGDVTKAAQILAKVPDKEYSLAILLSRVFASGWPAGAFAGMRMELHPKVTAAIFTDGETNDDKE
jgi:hypothetical protein